MTSDIANKIIAPALNDLQILVHFLIWRRQSIKRKTAYMGVLKILNTEHSEIIHHYDMCIDFIFDYDMSIQILFCYYGMCIFLLLWYVH